MDVLANGTIFIVLFNILALTYIMGYTSDYVPWWFLLLAVPFAFLMFLRRHVRIMPLFLSIHVIFLVLPVIIFSTLYAIVAVTAFAAISVGYSIHARLKEELKLRGVWIVLFMAALATVFFIVDGLIRHVAGMNVLVIISSIVVLCAAVLYIHLENVDFSMRILSDRYKKPVGNVLSSNNRIITGFLIILSAFGILSVVFPAQTVFTALTRAAVFIITLPIALLVALTDFLGSNPDPIHEGTPLLMPEDGYGYGGYMEEAEPDNFLEIMNAVYDALVWVVLVAVVIGAIAGVIYIVIKLHKVFGKKHDDENKESLMPDDTIGKLKFALGDLAAFLPRRKPKVKHPVRRAYIKKVNRHIKQGTVVLSSHTTEVIADNIRPNEDIDQLTETYEEARYGKM